MLSGSTATSGPPLHRPRHPTPATWTLSARPASATAASRLCLTACAFAERHPAATQTRMRIPPWRWRSFSPISSSSVRSILDPSFHVTHDTLGRLAADHRSVQDDGRGDPAGADTACLDEGQAAVGPGLAGADLGVVLDGLDQRGGALDVAGGPHADHARVPALRLEREEMIEGRDA